jgi:hypothetical protein
MTGFGKELVRSDMVDRRQMSEFALRCVVI